MFPEVLLGGLAGFLLAAGAVCWARHRRTVAVVSKIPGPPTNSFLGNLSRLWKLYQIEAATAHVYLFQLLCGLAHLYDKERIVRVWLSYRPVVILFKPETVEVVLSSQTVIDKSSEYRMLHSWLKTGLLTSSGSKWKARRKMLTPAFHFRILEDFLPIFNEQAKVLVSQLHSLSSKDSLNIVPFVTRCTLDIICESAMGVRINAQLGGEPEYVNAINEVGEAMVSRTLRPWLWPDFFYFLSSQGSRFKKNVRTLHDFTRRVILKKKKEIQMETVKSEEDRKVRRVFLDLLLHYHLTDGSLTEEDMCEEVDTFMFEGHDTTSLGISWALYNIGLYPEVQGAIHDELRDIFGEDTSRPATMDDLKRMKYLECALKESSRLYPSVPNIGRELKEDVYINGYTIPKGTTCYLLTFMLHRDPKSFPDPEKFKPDRFLEHHSAGRHPYAYIPFSAGPRNCIGQKFAMLELKVIVSCFLRHFHVRSLDSRDQVLLLPHIVLRPKSGLRLEIRRRHLVG